MMTSKNSLPIKSKLLFFKQYMRKPFGIGSITPSSQKLALSMVEHVGYRAGDKVVELGPGTGVFTQALLDHGVPKKDIVFVEQNATFGRTCCEP